MQILHPRRLTRSQTRIRNSNVQISNLIFFNGSQRVSNVKRDEKKKIQTAELWLSTTTRDWRFDYRRHAMLRPGVDVHHASIIETCVDRCFADNFSRVVAFLAQSWATRIPRRTIAGPAHRVRRLASIDAFHRYLGWFVGFGCSQRCQRVHWIYACFTDNQYDSQRCFVSQSLWVIMCAWYRFYLVHRVHVCFTDIEHDSQRCFVLQSLLLFRRVFFHRVRVCFTDFHRYDFGPFDVWSVCFKEHCCFTVFADCSQSLSKKWFTEFGKTLFTVFHFIHRVLFHRVCILIHRDKNVL